MKTKWNYSDLAQAYLKRPDYSGNALQRLFEISGAKPGWRVCDIGAGVAHLTLHLLEKDMDVVAVEPNDNMRALGMERTSKYDRIRWVEAKGEDTGQDSLAFDLVTFGSSFNVTDRQKALVESHRILKPGGWFACMWNHRDLNDPVQSDIEKIIQKYIPEYGYGTRREDQTKEIDRSGLLKDVQFIEGGVVHEQGIVDCEKAWCSHATLERQAGNAFRAIVDDIAAYLAGLGTPTINVPYTTRL